MTLILKNIELNTLILFLTFYCSTVLPRPLACSENIMDKTCHIKCVKSISRLNQTLFYYSIIRSQKISTGSGILP